MTKQQEDILFFAFRYALNRRTYAVDILVQAIIDNWDELEIETRRHIEYEIKDSFNSEMFYTSEDWREILKLK